MADHEHPPSENDELPGDERSVRVAAIYAAASARIGALLTKLAERGRPLSRRQRLALQVEVTRILDEALVAARPHLEAGIARAAWDAATPSRIRDQEAERIVRANLQRPMAQLVALKTDQAAGYLAAQTPLVGRRTDDLIRRVGLEQTLTRLERGLDSADQARRTERDLERRGALADINGDRFFIDKAGRKHQPANYARMVAHTTTREARTQGTILRARADGRDLVKVSRHPGGADPECGPYEGKVFSLTGATPGYPLLDKAPPFHPRCRHVLMPHSVRGASFRPAA